jgi:antitoxin VapB
LRRPKNFQVIDFKRLDAPQNPVVPRSEGAIAAASVGLAGDCQVLVCFCVVTYLYVVTAMPLNIRSEETEELATALAKLTGETKTEAVTQALRERIQRVRRARAKRRLADELDEIALHCSTLPVRDPRSADEIMGYDENGLPR